MACAQDDRKLRIIALLVDTPGYNELMLPKSAAEQLAEKTELAKHLEERNELVNERERKLQEQMEEQRRELQEQNEGLKRQLQQATKVSRVCVE